MENGHLMSEGQHLQLQRGPTPEPKGDQRKHCGQDRKHTSHDKAVNAKLQCFQSTRNYEQAQRKKPADTACKIFKSIFTLMLLFVAHTPEQKK
jgi:hypothetical protein